MLVITSPKLDAFRRYTQQTQAGQQICKVKTRLLGLAEILTPLIGLGFFHVCLRGVRGKRKTV